MEQSGWYHKKRISLRIPRLRAVASACMLIVLTGACDMSGRKKSDQAFSDEIKAREIKRVTEVQIFDQARIIGDSITTTSQKMLAANLKAAIANQGPSYAIQFCNVKAMPLVDSLSKEFGADIRRTSLRVRNPDNAATDLEKEILEAYGYSVENDAPISPNVQRIDEDFLLYTKPIMLDKELCLLCHGTPGQEITSPQLEALTSLYPADSAKGYHVGELRGMWSVKLSQKQVILSF